MAKKELLNTDQRVIFDFVLQDIRKAFIGCIHLIKGCAGTGKTFLTSVIVEEIVHNIKMKGNILCCASTHKAVRVMKEEAGISYQKVVFATVHSALGLREKIDGHGNVTYEPDKTIQKKIDKADFMIIDEASMLNDELFYLIMKQMRGSTLKIIMVGDPVQIPPIGKLDALPFQIEAQKEYKIKVSNLTSIIRQASGHPIIEKSKEIRHNLSSNQSFISRTDVESPVGSVYFCGKENLKEMFAEYFDTFDFKRNMDYARVIAWTNKKVDEYNKMIREVIYKQDKLPKIVIGEKLIINAPIVKRDRVILNNNDEVEVIGFKICKEEVKGLDKFIKYYDTTVKYETNFFGNMHHQIKIIHEDSDDEFDTICEQVKQVALDELKQNGPTSAKMYWVMYYNLKNYFAQVNWCYSTTVHKAQGSTYINTFIDESDIRKNSNVIERNRILYTAVTRCKRNCFIIN